MVKSLQEQLMGAGLVDQKKAKAIGKEKRKKAKQTPKGHQQEDEVKLAAKQKLAEKAERDRAMNQERQNINFQLGAMGQLPYQSSAVQSMHQ